MAPKRSTISGRIQSRSSDKVIVRRERGKVAQRAFRQRQIDAIKSLREENQALRAAIVAIDDAANLYDPKVLNKTVETARQLVDVLEQQQATESAATQVIEKNKTAHEADVVDNVHISRNVEDYLPAAFSGNISRQTHHDHGSDIEGHLPSTSFDQQIRLTGAPLDIVPYLGAEAYTVAGQIHWVTLAYSYSAVKAMRHPNPPKEAYIYVTKIFGNVLRRISIEGILDILHGRLIYRKNGFMTGDEHSARDPSLGRALMLSAMDQCAPTPKWYYLTAFDVADRVRQDLGSGFAMFEATLSGNINDGRASVMRELMRELALKAVCFGDGARWDPDDITAAIRRWVAETSGFDY
ncbi:hypothetical protein TruAng_005482 [Truncatella angustata]|nr:hypothetical protein TruAng_005482 [Truncatella angustata]